MIFSLSHHDDLYGNGNRQLGFISVIQLLHNEHHHHDHDGHHQVTDVGRSDLNKDLFKGLDGKQHRTQHSEHNSDFKKTIPGKQDEREVT